MLQLWQHSTGSIIKHVKENYPVQSISCSTCEKYPQKAQRNRCLQKGHYCYNSLDKVKVGKSANVSVYETNHPKKWNLVKKIIPWTLRIKPFNINATEVTTEAICAWTYNSTSVTWHIITGLCGPIFAATAALQLIIIKFNRKSSTFYPVCTIQGKSKEKIQECLAQYAKFLGVTEIKGSNCRIACKSPC